MKIGVDAETAVSADKVITFSKHDDTGQIFDQKRQRSRSQS